MKAPLYAGLACGLLLSACSQKSDTSGAAATTNAANTASSPATPPPAGYLGALANAQQKAVSTVDTTSLDKAIQLFVVENGRNPKDLNELVAQKFIPMIPDAPYGSKLVYDSSSGTVKVVKQQ